MRVTVVAIVLFLFWVALSGQFDWVHLSLGVLSSLLVAYFSTDLVLPSRNLPQVAARTVRLFRYLPWLLYKTAVANLDVAYRTLHPGMPIDPSVFRFLSAIESDFGHATLANSITLTPGTVTIDVDNDGYLVHALTQGTEADLVEMSRRVREIEQGPS